MQSRIQHSVETRNSVDPVFIDNHILVVNKPAGLLSQADRTGDPDVLTYWKAYIKERFHKPGNVYIGLVHRLDRPASGLMILARTSKAAGRLSAAFGRREVAKEYYAIVEGKVRTEGKFIDHLVKEKGRVRTAAETDEGARYAELDLTAIESHGGLTLVKIRLHTGRPHQIRVQLSRRDMPILGDMRYGASQELDGKNLALHAFRLALEHPVRHVPLEWNAPLPASWPDDFRIVVNG